jgi:hypothetical protein
MAMVSSWFPTHSPENLKWMGMEPSYTIAENVLGGSEQSWFFQEGIPQRLKPD